MTFTHSDTSGERLVLAEPPVGPEAGIGRALDLGLLGAGGGGQRDVGGGELEREAGLARDLGHGVDHVALVHDEIGRGVVVDDVDGTRVRAVVGAPGAARAAVATSGMKAFLSLQLERHRLFLS